MISLAGYEHEFGLEIPFERGSAALEFVEIPLEGRGAALD